MPIPQSVIERGKRADEMIRQMSGNPADAAPAPDQQPGGMEPAPSTPDPAAGTEVQPDAAGVQHNWKDRFGGLQRTHAAVKAELEQARAQAQREAELRRQADERIEKLEAQMQSVTSQSRDVDLSSLSEDDLVMVGEENARAFAKLAQHTAERLMSERLEAERQQQERQRAQLEAQAQAEQAELTKRDTFKDRLKAAVQNFDAIDTDPKFEQWINEPDQYTGEPRAQLLAGAFNTGDVGRAASFYRDFVAETRSDPRDSQVTPAPAGAPPIDPNQGNKKVWTRAEVSHFYKVVKPQLSQTDPSRATAIEADIFAAQREGRLR